MSTRGDQIPTGIQAMVSLASVDELFRDQLVRRRSAVAAAVGVWLTPSERAILDSIPEQLLRDLTERMAQPPQPRRSILRQIARTAVIALSAGLISQAAPGCATEEIDDPAGERGEQVAVEAQPGASPATEPAAEEPLSRVRGPMVMPYGIKGPSVMPDPHMARERHRLVQDSDVVVAGKGVRVARITVKGSMSKEVIRRVVDRHLNEVRFCCERELVTDPDRSGRVTVKFIISSTGAVQMAAVASSTLEHARTENCIARAVRRWLFPQSDCGGIVIATVVFDISPKSEGDE